MDIDLSQKPSSEPPEVDSFCSRCGCESCEFGHEESCDALREFADVRALTALDGPEGQSLFRFKRYAKSEDGLRFVTGLLALMLERVEQSVVDHDVSAIVVLPLSQQSFLSGKMHPNLVVYDALRARFAVRNSPLYGGVVSVGCGLHRGQSRSLQRRRSFRAPQLRWKSLASARSVLEDWRMDRVEWISAGQSHFLNRVSPGSSVLFIDDVLSSGYTAARFATAIDPEGSSRWLLLAAARTVRREALASRRSPSF